MKITPIAEYKNILLKRDDKFCLGDVNGGKLRQAIYLINKNLRIIKERYGSKVVCYCSLKSPQSAIISVVCDYFNLKCFIVTYKTGKLNRNLTIAQKYGAVIIGVPSGYNSVLEHYAKKINGFLINLGFGSNEIIDVNSLQCKNIPSKLDYLIVPVGSGYNFISIAKGLKRFGNYPLNLIGVFVGKDPTEVIKKYLDNSFQYKLIRHSLRYSVSINIDNYFFDPIYEAKAYDWIMKNISGHKKVLLWVIGKRNLDIIPQKINYKKLEDIITERGLNKWIIIKQLKN